MYNSITVSAQLLVLADRLGFGKICSGENADKRYRHFTARTQLYAMMIAQLTGQKGLRTIEETIASDNDLYHAGVSTHITRTNLAHANEKRPSGVFQKFYFHLVEHYKFLCGRCGLRKTTSRYSTGATSTRGSSWSSRSHQFVLSQGIRATLNTR